MLRHRWMRLLDRRHYTRGHYWSHLRPRRDNRAHSRRIEQGASKARRETQKLRVPREQSGHALFNLCDLGLLAELRLVVVEVNEQRFRPMHILRLLRETVDNRFEHGACI